MSVAAGAWALHRQLVLTIQRGVRPASWLPCLLPVPSSPIGSISKDLSRLYSLAGLPSHSSPVPADVTKMYAMPLGPLADLS